MRHHCIQRQEKHRAQQKAACRRHPAGQSAGLFGHLYGGYQKAPYAGRHHHPGGKAQKHPLKGVVNLFSEKEHHAGARRRHQKGKARTQGRHTQCVHTISPFCRRTHASPADSPAPARRAAACTPLFLSYHICAKHVKPARKKKNRGHAVPPETVSGRFFIIQDAHELLACNSFLFQQVFCQLMQLIHIVL